MCGGMVAAIWAKSARGAVDSGWKWSRSRTNETGRDSGIQNQSSGMVCSETAAATVEPARAGRTTLYSNPVKVLIVGPLPWTTFPVLVVVTVALISCAAGITGQQDF